MKMRHYYEFKMRKIKVLEALSNFCRKIMGRTV